MGELSNYIYKYLDHIKDIENRIISEQKDTIDAVAGLMLDVFESGHNIFAFGPGHAGMFSEEMFYRAGGLAITNPLFFPGVMIDENPITLTSAYEVLPGFASVMLKNSPLKKGDLLFIHSVAARNPVVVELAIKAKTQGVHVVSIINMDYASQVTSRDPSGKMLQDVSDIVIDTCGDLGDASISVEGIPCKVAPTSSISGCFIAICLQLQFIAKMLEQGKVPPIFQSANVDGGAEYNAKLLEKYKSRIFYMGFNKE